MLSFNLTPTPSVSGPSNSVSTTNKEDGVNNKNRSRKTTKQPVAKIINEQDEYDKCISLSSEINNLGGDFLEFENSNLQVTLGAVVCVEADIRGDVKIGLKTIVHPCAKILALHGPIVIGDANIIEELAVIENKSSETLVIGNNNVFEVGSTVYAESVGDHNVFETKCYVGETVKVGNGCIFGAGTRVTQPTSVQDNSVYFGEPLKHRIAGERPTPQTLQIDFLSRILPNYHHVKNPSLKKEIGN